MNPPVPPEPEPPEPPEPSIPEYTYLSSSEVSLGAVTGTFYKAIQQDGVSCGLTTTDGDNQTQHYYGIILYDDVLGDPQCYFVRGNSPLIGILGNNSAIGLDVTLYSINNGNVRDTGVTEHLDSSTPSDYYTNIKTRNFTLTQRS